MTSADIVDYRLFNQQISESKFKKPGEIVEWLGAMQAQEFAMAKWAIGLRLPGCTNADVEKSFNKGDILRTHLLRPTWHFVTPADIRWLLALTAPRINAASAFMYRKLELDNKVFTRSNDTIVKALQGGKHLTRIALKSALEKAKINAVNLRLSYLMMQAEIEGIICSGARQGNQFTYALLDERVTSTKSVQRPEALAALAHRYFTSRGPATLRDFTTWSGLTVKEAKEGMASVSAGFLHETINGAEYVFASEPENKTIKGQRTFLLPDYDEYGISYKDRSAIFSKITTSHGTKNGNPIFTHMIVIDGIIEGTWQRIIKNNTIAVKTTFFSPLSKKKQNEVLNALKRYSLFFNKSLANDKILH